MLENSVNNQSKDPKLDATAAHYRCSKLRSSAAKESKHEVIKIHRLDEETLKIHIFIFHLSFSYAV